MKYFIVFQNQTFQHEFNGGYIWAPQKAESGFNVHHWSRMLEIQPGDLIFSVVKQRVVSINKALSSAVAAKKPAEMQNGNTWAQEGNLVKVKYNILQKNLSTKENMHEILPLAQHKYSPFTSTGNGNQGYLYSVTNELGEYLIRAIRENNNLDIPMEHVNKGETESLAEIVMLDKLLDKEFEETTRQQLIKVRIGQGVFRDKLFTRSSSCEICEIGFKPLLRASHCKPWSNSNNEERLSIDNGLLLCVEHDVLFDNGFIAFNKGSLVISQLVPQLIQEKLTPYVNRNHKFNERQQEFLNWHRENLFKDRE